MVGLEDQARHVVSGDVDDDTSLAERRDEKGIDGAPAGVSAAAVADAHAHGVESKAAVGAASTNASDSGQCLSMHQPWASLLVLGIKRFEGRGWPTEHRGRLWIASAARTPEPDEIKSVEAEYRCNPLSPPPLYLVIWHRWNFRSGLAPRSA